MSWFKAPPLLPSALVGPLAATLDRAVTVAVTARHQFGNSRVDDEQLMARAAQAAEYFAGIDADTYFDPPKAIQPVETKSIVGSAVDLSWLSTHRVQCEAVRDVYASHVENQHASVRLFGGSERRPIAVLVHGYMGGAFTLEQRIWPIRWLDSLGFDSALFTLPFHGERAPKVDRTPPFPQSDIRFTAEGFRQSVGDLRDFVAWLRERGHPEVGLMGMSLGGYVSSLTATVESTLAFLVPIVPLACLGDFARDQGRMPRGSRQALAYEQTLKRAYRLTSPLARAPRIASERVLVVAGKADRITPPAHARMLARHFSAPLEAWTGGHLLQFGRARSLQRVGSFLRALPRS
ncbi:MAG TPA: alpha/beta fold hydrolase, partial [Polyangiaceae bacterium]|nr:alpha/beta fold hydrolase [Polyangiaceae bacterium]